jgi:hypothetical protein
MPILGTVASQFAGKPFSSFESIATATVTSGGTTTIDFDSIPSTYTHLQIRYSATANAGSNLFIKMNGDTGSNYRNHALTSYGYALDTGTDTNRMIGIVQPTYPGLGVVDLLDYKDTSKYKVVKFISGSDSNGGTRRNRIGSVLWKNTSAVTRLEITSDGTIEQYSKFALYGIKGA